MFDGEIPRAIGGTIAFYGICAALGVGAGVLVRQPTIAIGVLIPWALFAERALGAFLPTVVPYLPFTAGAQLSAVTTQGEPLDRGSAQPCSSHGRPSCCWSGRCCSSGVTSRDLRESATLTTSRHRRSRTRWATRAVPSAIVVPSNTPATASKSQCAPR